MNRIRAALDALHPRARLAAIALAALVVLGAYAALVSTLDRARTGLQASVTALRAASQHMERHALDIARLRSAPKPAASPRDLRSIVEGEARAGGFTLRVDTSAADEVRVIVASVAFPEWLAWLERLQLGNVRVKSCRVEALSADGVVTATATLVRTP